jgi:hypothetical protein
MHAIMREVLFEPLSAASERAAELGVGNRIPLGFDQWFAHCLTRDTSARLQNGALALEELERCLGNGPRGTMPHPPSYAEIEAVQREHEQEQQAQAQAHEIEPHDAVQDMIDAPLESDAFPPTLPAAFETTGPQPPPPPRAPVVSVAAPVSSAPPTSTNNAASDDFVRRSSVPSMIPPIKSTAPLWMLAGGLVVLLVVVVVFVKQRADVQQSTPPKAVPATTAVATGAPLPTAAPPPPTATAAPPTSAAPTAPATSVATAPPQPPSPTDAPSFPDTVDTASPGTGAGKTFDTTAATAALRSAALAARDCKRSYGPTGAGTVKVTFAPTGNVTSALLLAPEYAGTLVGTCVATKFLKLRVPPFEGTAVTTNMPFEIPP